jgi:hypothetical protein
VLASQEALPLGLAQPRLGLNQGIDGVNVAVLLSQPDQPTNEVAQVRRGFLACSDGCSTVTNVLGGGGRRQLFGDVVEVDLEMMCQEVDR